MKFGSHAGRQRTIDVLREWVTRGRGLDLVTPEFSLFAFEALSDALSGVSRARMVLPPISDTAGLLGSASDRAARNRLQSRWLARRCADWINTRAEIRYAASGVPQGSALVRDEQDGALQALLGSFAFTTAGLGITPGNPLSLVQITDTAEEATVLAQWFDAQWTALSAHEEHKANFVNLLRELSAALKGEFAGSDDCDWLINYDIHWNPVRIIQRFGRIDRLGSHNDRIQLVNFWPNMELEEYIGLEQKVSGQDQPRRHPPSARHP